MEGKGEHVGPRLMFGNRPPEVPCLPQVWTEAHNAQRSIGAEGCRPTAGKSPRAAGVGRLAGLPWSHETGISHPRSRDFGPSRRVPSGP